MLTIESLESRHISALQEIIADREMAETSDIPSDPEPDAASGWVARMRLMEEEGTGRTFAVVADGVVVGACGLHHMDREHGTAELGFFVGKRYWRRGYAVSACRLLLARAFAGLGLQSVHAGCLAWNEGANAVLRKLDFQPSHDCPPPPESKFPATETYRYWCLAREQWISREASAANAGSTASVEHPGI